MAGREGVWKKTVNDYYTIYLYLMIDYGTSYRLPERVTTTWYTNMRTRGLLQWKLPDCDIEV